MTTSRILKDDIGVSPQQLVLFRLFQILSLAYTTQKSWNRCKPACIESPWTLNAAE